MSKNVLIIGGMGPQASLELHIRIIERATANGAQHGEDFPAITHISIPVPDKLMKSTDDKSVALRVIKAHLQPIRQMRFTRTVLACNTAHLLQPQIEMILKVKLSSLITLTAARTNSSGVIGLLASPTTIDSDLYRNALSDEVLTLPKHEQVRTEACIRSVIAGKPEKQILNEQIAMLKNAGAEQIILGCTELSVLSAHNDDPQIIDPLNIVVDEIFNHHTV